MNELTTKDFFSRTDVRQKFEEMLGKRAPAFITSVLQVIASNELLKQADVMTIYNSAAVAATLELPINNQLGFAYIVPYKTKQPDGSTKVVAQFQIGYKGFIQLAQRSGQFENIACRPVYDSQMINDNSFDGFHFDWSQKKSDIVIGYAAYFKLLNGFEKTLFMSIDDLKKHGKRYSQTFKYDKGLWKDDPEIMYGKTVLKLLLAKYAPLSIEMQKAVITDQAVINDTTGEDVTYLDNELPEINKELERFRLLIEDAKTIQDLKALKEIPEQLLDLYNDKFMQIEESAKVPGKLL